MLTIADLVTNIHLAKQATPTMAPIFVENDMKARLAYRSTMEPTHIEKLQLPVLSNQLRQIPILPQMQTYPLISLGVLCDD